VTMVNKPVGSNNAQNTLTSWLNYWNFKDCYME
jgi:hypothetical protein